MAKDYPEFNNERSAAFKWVAMGMPEDLASIERSYNVRWSDMMRESPFLKDLPKVTGIALDATVKSVAPAPLQPFARFPEGELKETLKEFPTELIGDTIELGTDPLSWMTAAALQVGIPAAVKVIANKYPAFAKFMTKQRGDFPALEAAYKELGLNPNASGTEIEAAYRKSALRNHPDRGGDPDAFGRATDAVDLIRETRTKWYKEIEVMYKNSRLSDTRGFARIGRGDMRSYEISPENISKGRTKDEILADIGKGKLIDQNAMRSVGLDPNKYILNDRATLAEAEQLRPKAIEKQLELDRMVEKVVDEVPGAQLLPHHADKTTTPEIRAKSATSLALKVSRKKAEGEAGYAFADVSDHARNAILIKDINDAATIKSVLKSFAKQGSWTLETKLSKPHASGYMGIFLKSPNNQEVQIHTPKGWDLKVKTDLLFRDFRTRKMSSLTPAEREEVYAIQEQTRKMYEDYYAEALGGSIKDFESLVSAKASESGIALESRAAAKGKSVSTQAPAAGEKALPAFKSTNIPESVKPNLDIGSPSNTSLSQEGAAVKERQFISSVKQEMPQLKVAGQYIPRDTDELAIKARTLIRDDIATAERMALEGTDDAAIAVGAELLKHYTTEAEKVTSPQLKDAMLERASELANHMAVKLTELGRSVQAAAILSRMTPEGQLKFAASAIKKYNEKVAKQKGGLFGAKKPVPELTPEQTSHIINEMNALKKMAEGEAKAMRFQKLQEYIQNIIPSSIKDKVLTVWKAGLLSSPTTHLKNISANAFFAGAEALKDLPATAIDRMVALISKRVTKVPTIKGYGAGFKEGMKKGFKFIKTSYDERNVLMKYDYRKVNFGDSPAAKGIQRYTDTIFRLLGAEDQPFYYGARLRSLYEQARADAINKGLKGAEAQAHVDNLVMNPTDEMALLATEDAKIAVFQNETALGNVAKELQHVGGDAGEFLLPFGRTPSAVATQILNYTPVGALKTIIQNTGKGRFDQKSFSEGMGRAVTGTAVLGLGAYLYMNGRMTLDRPKTKQDRDLWEAEGRKENSIYLAGAWRSIDSFGPAGNVLLIGGHFADAYKRTGSVIKALMDSQAYFGSIKSFTEQTFLKSMNAFMTAVNDPENKAASFSETMLGSAVPSVVGRAASAVDKKIRRTGSVTDKLKSRIPFLSLTLEPRVDLLGQELERSSNFAEMMLDPTAPQRMKSDPVVKELRRLQDLKMDVQTTRLGGKEGYEVLTPQENTQLLKDAGQEAYARIKELMSDKNYRAIPDDEKALRINEIFTEAKERARIDMAIQVTKGLKGQALNDKIKKIVKSKLLTSALYEEYLMMR
jgi:hypothetical protein